MTIIAPMVISKILSNLLISPPYHIHRITKLPAKRLLKKVTNGPIQPQRTGIPVILSNMMSPIKTKKP